MNYGITINPALSPQSATREILAKVRDTFVRKSKCTIIKEAYDYNSLGYLHLHILIKARKGLYTPRLQQNGYQIDIRPLDTPAYVQSWIDYIWRKQFGNHLHETRLSNSFFSNNYGFNGRA